MNEVNVNSLSNEMLVESHSGYLRSDGERNVNMNNDKNANLIFNSIRSNYPELAGKDNLATYYKEIQGIPIYRLIYLNANYFLQEIQILLIPDVIFNSIQYDSLSNFQSSKIYTTGFSFFMNKYGDQLKDGRVQRIGRMINGNYVYYALEIIVGNTVYRGVYGINTDFTILFDQLQVLQTSSQQATIQTSTQSSTQLNNQIFTTQSSRQQQQQQQQPSTQSINQIFTTQSSSQQQQQQQQPSTQQQQSTQQFSGQQPSNPQFSSTQPAPTDQEQFTVPLLSRFSALNIEDFTNSRDFSIVMGYLSEIRSAQEQGSKLLQVWSYSTQNYDYYLIIFSIYGQGLLKVVNINKGTRLLNLISQKSLSQVEFDEYQVNYRNGLAQTATAPAVQPQSQEVKTGGRFQLTKAQLDVD